MSYTPKNNFNLQIGRTGIGKRGFRKKILADVACCDNLKGYEYYGGFPLETSLEFSRDMAVHGGCPNFSWEVIDSVYFTFAHATTAGRTNTVNADPTVPIDAEELAIVEDNCGHQLVFVILFCGGGISIIPYSPIPPDPPDDPPYDPSWPPPTGPGVGEDCCEGVTIGYTTQQMQVGENQTLTVENPNRGCLYEWSIASGGGSLSQDYGLSTIYTAPGENAHCVNNPVIILKEAGKDICDSLALAVNGSEDLEWAVRVWSDKDCEEVAPGTFNCTLTNNTYACLGDLMASYPCVLGRQSSGAGASCDVCYEKTLPNLCYSDGKSMNTLLSISPIDLRSDLMKERGCCPEQLL